jgi:ParB-like chromosome segregation protein Spo0J
MEFLELNESQFISENTPCREPSNELISSIAMRGQLVPIIVEAVHCDAPSGMTDPEEVKANTIYRIVDGRRRKRAIEIINETRRQDGFGESLMRIYAVEVETGESAMPHDALHTLTANLLRERNEAMEASAIGILTDNGHGHEDIAKELGISKSVVAQLDDIRRKLQPEAWAKLEEGKMSFSTAKRLLRLDAKEQAAVVSRANGSRITGKAVDEVRRETRIDLLAGLPSVAAAQPGTLLAGQLESYTCTATLTSDQRIALDRAVAILYELHGTA